MSEPLQIAIVVGLPPTIAAIGAIIVGVRNSRKAAVIIAKADEIHATTNSNLTRVTDELMKANAEIGNLRATIAASLMRRPQEPPP